MSRHGIVPANAAHEITVGWDPPLQTFFAQVMTEDAEGEVVEILWRGFGSGLSDEILEADKVIDLVRPYAAFIPPQLIDELRLDRQENR
jgi:hypothetical protein